VSYRLSSRVTTYSWIVLAVVALSGVCNLSRIVMDLNWLATTAAKLPM
jgi:hypothetical protein